MRRIYHSKIRDTLYLSRLLDALLQTLEQCPLEVRLKALSFDAQIPEPIFRRLQNLYKNPEDAPNITAQDYHILFANILFRFPTVRMYVLKNGSFFFKM